MYIDMNIKKPRNANLDTY